MEALPSEVADLAIASIGVSESVPSAAGLAPAIDDPACVDAEAEAGAVAEDQKRVKRKLALVIGYLGSSYRGLTMDLRSCPTAAVKSVEYVLLQAMLRAGLVHARNADAPERKIGWSRSSRTDAGVSALRQIISGRFLVPAGAHFSDGGHCPEVVHDLNGELPPDLRCFSAVRVPGSFDARAACSWREYAYVLPLEMVRPPGCDETPQQLAGRVEQLMRQLQGPHSFHNFSRLRVSDLFPDVAKEPKSENKEQQPPQQGEGEDLSAAAGKGGGRSKRKRGRGSSRGRGGRRREEATPLPLVCGQEAVVVAPSRESGDEGMQREEETELAGATAADPVIMAEDAAASVPTANGDVPPPLLWAEVFRRDEGSGGLRERDPRLRVRAQTTIWMTTVELAQDGFLRVRIRGQCFFYNQVRLMVGTAAAIAAGILAEELLGNALRLPVEMHLPLAPATGLYLVTSGFSQLDQRAGFFAMDSSQARSCMLPADGHVLLDEAGERAGEEFADCVEAELANLWRTQGDAEAWLQRMACVRWPSPTDLADLQKLAAENALREAETRSKQEAADLRRRSESLQMPSSSPSDLLPRRFASSLMLRFGGLLPGCRLQGIQHALGSRIRCGKFSVPPGSGLDSGSLSLPSTEQLLSFVADVGLLALAEEGLASL